MEFIVEKMGQVAQEKNKYDNDKNRKNKKHAGGVLKYPNIIGWWVM